MWKSIIAENCKKRILLLAQALILCPSYKLIMCLCSTFLRYMSVEVLRESACDCIHEIIMKGMEPLAKKELVESLLSVLEKSGILEPQEVHDYSCLSVTFLSKIIL